MYKDKQKQREAQRERQRRYRAKAKGVTSQGVTQGITGAEAIAFESLGRLSQGVTGIVEGYPDPVFTSLMAKAKPGLRRVSKPGDDDYVPMCETTRKWAGGLGGEGGWRGSDR